jgi:DNA primase
MQKIFSGVSEMPRIPQNDIERLKEEVSVARLVEASGIELKKTGKDLAGRCPFHEDDTASLIVTPAKNLWHCFGCQIGGGPIDWVMKRNGVSFRHAVELLREGVPATSSLAADPVKRTTVRALPAPVAFDADDQALLNQTIAYYHERYLATSEAAQYLAARGLSHPELAATFRLGVADRTLGLRLPEKNRKAGAEVRARLQKVGLLRESGHEHFNGSLVVPILDEAGNVVEVYGRKLLDNLRTGTPKHLYLPAEKRAAGRGVFNRAALQSKEVILCEAILDALSFWCAGFRNVTTAYGIEGFTDELLAAFKTHGIERVLIAYDRDEPGERAAEKVAERLMAEGMACWRIQFPKGMDANSYALKVQPADKSLGLLIRKAVWLGTGQAPGATPQGTAPESAPALALQPPPLVASEASEAVPLPSASPVAAPMPTQPDAVIDGDTLRLACGAHVWQVRGLPQKSPGAVLKLNVRVQKSDGDAQLPTLALHVDSIDLYNARARAVFATQAAAELRVSEDVLRREIGRVLLACEEAIAQREQAANAPKEPALPTMTDAEREAALIWLRAPDLLAQILADFDACGLTGETTNKLVGYLAAVSRKLDRPLGVVVQSSSAAGKTTLMDAVLAFVPDEDKVKYSAMSGQSLFYIGQTNLRHKVLAIAEEEGASRASYALKLLQSEGELTMASTGKDAATGNLVTQTYHVEGPVALLLTTTARDLDEELMNRCLVLAVDEGREQTRAIHQRQRARRTLDGLLARQARAACITVQQNAQRLLRPLAVLNPFAQHLSFPDQTTRLRRDHEKYLTLIDTIAFLHQHQRPVQTAQQLEYIEVTLTDIEQANAIAHEVLGRSLDELPPQTRRLLQLVDQYVVSECARQQIARADLRFSRRALREAIHWGDTQLKVHLSRLVELEYLVTHRGQNGTRTGGFEYELVYELGPDGQVLRLPGLTDMDALRHRYDAARSGLEGSRSAPGRGVVGPQSAVGRGKDLPAEPIPMRLSGQVFEETANAQYTTKSAAVLSYPQAVA